MHDEAPAERHFWSDTLKLGLVAIVIVLVVRIFIAQPFVVEGPSMEPTFENHDYLIVDELSYHFEAPQRGQVIVFRYPVDPTQFFIKRIIGLPGETLIIKGNVVTIKNSEYPNGFVLSEPYLNAQYLNPDDLTNETITLGADQYFVMGDHRADSEDSRIWGPLPKNLIIGHVVLRLFPFNEVGLSPGGYTFPIQ